MIFGLQEIKCLSEEVPEAAKLKGYHQYWNSKPGGHGGVAIYSKVTTTNQSFIFQFPCNFQKCNPI